MGLFIRNNYQGYENNFDGNYDEVFDYVDIMGEAGDYFKFNSNSKNLYSYINGIIIVRLI